MVDYVHTLGVTWKATDLNFLAELADVFRAELGLLRISKVSSLQAWSWNGQPQDFSPTN
jgi:hypothetical protein